MQDMDQAQAAATAQVSASRLRLKIRLKLIHAKTALGAQNAAHSDSRDSLRAAAVLGLLAVAA